MNFYVEITTLIYVYYFFLYFRKPSPSIPAMKRRSTCSAPVSGRTLKVLTNEPALQFYGGSFITGTMPDKYGNTIAPFKGLALETQHIPDSPNHPNFPSIMVEPGEQYYSLCIYQFGVE